MIRSYLIIALRNLQKRKVYSFINVFGLSIGLATVMLIVLYMRDELSYDRFHQDAENIYRVAWWSGNPQTRTPHPMAQAMVTDFPEATSAVSLSPIWGPGLTKRVFSIKNPDQEQWFQEARVLSVDSTFFDVFSFNMVKGNREEVLQNVGGVMISQTMAKKYFGDQDPINKQLAIDNDTLLVQVEGVFEDVPDNSHFHFDFLVSYVTMKAFSSPESEYYTWRDFGHFNYVRLHPDTDIQDFEAKLMPWVGNYMELDEETMRRIMESSDRFRLQRITDIHLKSSIRWELEANGNMGYIYIMSVAAIFILVIACFNFMNLSTARSMERASEVGVRKVVGAHRTQLYYQFLGESVLLTFIAAILSGLLVEVILPYFNAFTGKSLSLSLSSPYTILVMLLTVLIIGVLAGFYPAGFLSAMRPVTILKGDHSTSISGGLSRKLLVLLQFSISTFLIAGASTVIQQLDFMRNKDLGFNPEEVIVVPLNSRDVASRMETVLTEVTSLDGVVNAGAASNVPGWQYNQNPIFMKDNPEERVNISQCFTDYDLLSTLGIEITDGRSFEKDRPSDQFTAFIINESAVKALNIEDPVGKIAVIEMDGSNVEGEIIGVTNDYNYVSLHEPIRPLVIHLVPAYNYMVVRVSTNDLQNTIARVESKMLEFDNKMDFEFNFLNEKLDSQYSNEERMATVFGSFAVLAIIIACLGLGGLTAINYSFRKKEISIKKVMGASTRTLAINLLKENTTIVLLAILISGPFYWIMLNNWLSNFNYRIALQPSTFLFSGLLLVVISWLTLSYLTIKTIRTNPIKSLRES